MINIAMVKWLTNIITSHSCLSYFDVIIVVNQLRNYVLLIMFFQSCDVPNLISVDVM